MARNSLTYILGIEKNSIFSNSSHLEWRVGLSDTNLKGTHPGTIPARFGLSSNFNCRYMARNSLTYNLGFSVKFFFQPIYTDYANWAYFDKRSHSNLLLLI
jgi:hypothetical protein